MSKPVIWFKWLFFQFKDQPVYVHNIIIVDAHLTSQIVAVFMEFCFATIFMESYYRKILYNSKYMQ